jgi:hypothetical protein
MGNLAQQIIDNQRDAAITQQALRNNRRVISKPFTDHDSDSDIDIAKNRVVMASKATAPDTESESDAHDDATSEVQVEPKRRRSRNKPEAVMTSALEHEPESSSVSNATQLQTIVPESKSQPSNIMVSLPNTAITMSPLDLPTEYFSAGLDRRKQNRNLLMQWLSTSMVEDIDFGRIHIVGRERCQLARMGQMKKCREPSHWSKPCLFKSGAEKITGMLGMTVHYPSMKDYESAVLAKVELQIIVMRCELRDAHGNVVAEGIGARDLKQDWGDINKALKMCAKSAHIDATLRLAGISAIFTQDLEDKPPPDSGDFNRPAPSFSSVSVVSKQATPVQLVKSTVSKANASVFASEPEPVPDYEHDAIQSFADETPELAIGKDELANLRKAIADHGFTEKRVVSWLIKSTHGQVLSLEQLPKARYTSLFNRLEQWAENECFQSSTAIQ